MALYASMGGGVIALIVAVADGYLRRAVANLGMLVTYWRVVGIRALPELTLQDGHAPRLPYAVPIIAGILVMLWLR